MCPTLFLDSHFVGNEVLWVTVWGGTGRGGEGKPPGGSPKVFPLSLPRDPLAVRLSENRFPS